jgi:AcrR family transcriptional regulator
MLAVAQRAFAQRGYHAASVDAIAEAAGITKPMVYAYLGTKEELFIACLHREATRMVEAVVAAVRPSYSPAEQLWHGLNAFFGFVAAHRDGWTVLYRQSRGQEPFASELAAMRRRFVDIVAALLTRAVALAGGRAGPAEHGDQLAGLHFERNPVQDVAFSIEGMDRLDAQHVIKARQDRRHAPAGQRVPDRGCRRR